jgi:hypothetical protein
MVSRFSGNLLGRAVNDVMYSETYRRLRWRLDAGISGAYQCPSFTRRRSCALNATIIIQRINVPRSRRNGNHVIDSRPQQILHHFLIRSSRQLDRADNVTRIVAHEDNSGRFHRNIRASADSNSDVRCSKCRCIVHAVALDEFPQESSITWNLVSMQGAEAPSASNGYEQCLGRTTASSARSNPSMAESSELLHSGSRIGCLPYHSGWLSSSVRPFGRNIETTACHPTRAWLGDPVSPTEKPIRERVTGKPEVMQGRANRL